MTFEDLMKIFKVAGRRHMSYGEYNHDEGVRAVVTALSNVLETEFGQCEDCTACGVHDHIDKVFKEILGKASNETG
jgi:hypothetical protein